MELFTTEMLLQVLLWLGAATLIGAGIFGLIFPAIPGPPLLFAGLWMAAWIEGFEHVGLWTLCGLGLLALLGVLADFVAGALGAKRFGASGRSVLGATLGLILGTAAKVAMGLVMILVFLFMRFT